MSIIIFIISLAVLIFVHELGHFLAAKAVGIRVDEFGLGFPPKVWSKQKGETLYTLNAVPFGGFVRIFGEDPHLEEISEADKPRSMFYQPAYVKAMVLAAGVAFNIIFAWLLISLGFVIGLPSPVEHSGFGQVQNAHVVVIDVLPNSPAEKAGLRSGDTIDSVTAGQTLQNEALTPESISTLVSGSNSQTVDVTYTRGTNQSITAHIVPDTTTVSGRRAIGIAMDKVGTLKLPIHLALLEGMHTTGLLIKNTVIGFGVFLSGLFSHGAGLSQVSGPVGIAHVFSQAGALGFVYIISLVALISINLAVINLVPFPALDGGRLLFVLIEAVIRRPVSPKILRWTNAIGFAILLILMGAITIHDILKLI